MIVLGVVKMNILTYTERIIVYLLFHFFYINDTFNIVSDLNNNGIKIAIIVVTVAQ